MISTCEFEDHDNPLGILGTFRLFLTDLYAVIICFMLLKNFLVGIHFYGNARYVIPNWLSMTADWTLHHSWLNLLAMARPSSLLTLVTTIKTHLPGSDLLLDMISNKTQTTKNSNQLIICFLHNVCRTRNIQRV